ncbi:NAD/NADP octopine/nopaline dehydrogenase family protein [Ottowia thiooxydans]|uniref:Opine dehydrogenase n=1 Tax=Ottowia thiooxydans TaxID=219182 RepID=A0ABV2Q4E9_9BURK
MADSLDLAVIGAGPIGILSATLASLAGHRVGLWSPRTPVQGARITLRCSGKLESAVEVENMAGPDSLGSWSHVLVALPATAYDDVLGRAAPFLRSQQTVIFSGALSLVQFWLKDILAKQGSSPELIAWGTTLGTASRVEPLHARVSTVRPRLGVSALPSERLQALTQVCARLFGDRFEAAPAHLATLLANINPVAHAGQVIPNLTRIEHGEPWRLFANFTSAGTRIANAIDAERLEIGLRLGLQLRSLADHYRLSFGVEGDDLAALAQSIEAAGLGSQGPESVSHRYIEEDVPYGLVTLQRIGAVVGVETPHLDIAIELLSCALNRPYGEMNRILQGLGLESETPASLAQRFS